MPARITEQDIENAAAVLRDQIALVEGPHWHADDTKHSSERLRGSTARAVESFLRLDFGLPIVIFGRGNVSHYYIEPNGTVVFSESHNRPLADKARAYKFHVK